MKKNQNHPNFSLSTSPQQRSQSGLTLIEFLVVAVIIGILGMIGAMSFMPSLEKSRDGRRKADLSNLTKALQAYNSDYGSYPASNASGQIVGCNSSGSPVACQWGGTFTDTKGTVYMGRLPQDPQRFDYFYLFDPVAGGYALLARLENRLDPVRAMTDPTPPAVPQRGVYTYSNPPAAPVLLNTACGGDGCSYVQHGPTARLTLPVVPE